MVLLVFDYVGIGKVVITVISINGFRDIVALNILVDVDSSFP